MVLAGITQRLYRIMFAHKYVTGVKSRKFYGNGKLIEPFASRELRRENN